MATYKMSDLINQLYEIGQDGFDYVDISLLESEEFNDDIIPESLAFSAYDEQSQGSIDYDGVESCEISEPNSNSSTINIDDYCYKLGFTFQEVLTIKHCIDNSLEYFKYCLDDPSCSRETKDEIKEASIKARNLQAKLVSFTKYIR